MRRGVGVGAMKHQEMFNSTAVKAGEEIKENQILTLKKQLETFRKNLVIFADKHNSALNKDPFFRAQFMKMCNQVGIDPLTTLKSSTNAFNLDDFYLKLLLQILDIFKATELNLISMADMLKYLMKRRNVDDLNENDVEEALKRISQLDKTYSIIRVSGVLYIQANGTDCSSDMNEILKFLKSKRKSTKEEIASCTQLDIARVTVALNDLMRSGTVWIDKQENVPVYFIFDA